MSRYSLRNRSSCIHENSSWKDEVASYSNAPKSLLENTRPHENIESNLSPSILKKFQKMTTFSPQKPRNLKRSAASHSSKKNKKEEHHDSKAYSQDTDSLMMNCDDKSTSLLNQLGMTDADMQPVELPERYNYEIWEDPNLDILEASDKREKQIHFEADEKENLWTASAILHAFSPFKKNREERALKALSIASFPEYLHLKGQFFNEFGKSFFKRKEKDHSRFKATKINLFRNRVFHSRSNPSYGNNSCKTMDGEADVDPICKIPTPEVAKPAFDRATTIQFSPMEQSQISAFRSIRKDSLPAFNSGEQKSNQTAADHHDFHDTPFNTPRSDFKKRSVDHDISLKDNGKMGDSKDLLSSKRNLRPRPTRPPTLFGFASDCSEDDSIAGNTYRKRRK